MNTKNDSRINLKRILPLGGQSPLLTAVTFALYFAVVAFSFWNDAHFFVFDFVDSKAYGDTSGNPHALLFYITLKAVFLPLMYWVVRGICSMVYEAAHGNRDKQRQLFITGGLFLVYTAVFAVVFPGIWWNNGTDEITCFSFAMHLQAHNNQGFGMTVFFILAQMLYGHPATVVFVQYSIGCVIQGFLVYHLLYQKQKKGCAILLAVLFFTPFMMYFAFLPMRAYLTGMFFALFLYTYYCLSGNLQADKPLIARMIILAVVVSNLRIEMLFLLIALPLMLIARYRVKGQGSRPVWKVAASSFGAIALSVVVAVGWTALGNKDPDPTHDMLSFLAPLGEILAHDENVASKEDLARIDEFFDVEKMKEEHKDPANYKNFRYERFNKKSKGLTFPKEHYLGCQLTMVKIFLKRPDIYLQNKATVAYHTLGFTSDGRIGHRMPEKMDPKELSRFFDTNPSEASKAMKRFLAGDYSVGFLKAKQLNFPTWIPLVLMLVQFVASIAMRKKTPAIMSAVVLTAYFLVIVAATSNWVMYYFASGFSGVLVFTVTLSDFIAARKQKRSAAASTAP